MTPLELARTECANYDQGACLAIGPRNLLFHAIDNSQYPRASCLLHLDQRCSCFERCVLPVADRGHAAFLQARQIYRGTHALAKVKGEAPKCACGATRAPRKRFCARCARQHRKTTFRNAKRRERQSEPSRAVAMSTVKPENEPAND